MSSSILDNYLCNDVHAEIYADIDRFMDMGGEKCDLGRYSDGTTLLMETNVHKDDKRGYLAKSDNDDEEVIITVTGVLMETNLPPYMDIASLYRTRPNKKDVPVNRVSIGWFGHGNFESNRLALEHVRNNFQRKFASVVDNQFLVKAGVPMISLENRIVSKVDDVPLDVLDATLNKAYDPRDIIRKNLLDSGKHRFVDDNTLAFYKLVTKDGDDMQTEPCAPEEFKIGMIVCVRATPTLVPSTKGGHKLILKLRSLLLVDDKIYKKFLFAQSLNDVESVPKPGSGLKRSACDNDWLNPKRRAMDMGDAQIREKRHNGQGKKRVAGDESLVEKMQGLETSDTQKEGQASSSS
ncbi:unnamed protein product [Peniophora sp. CBMAI 1063]|nr:unnamed protein product [Peniophora sp. CBMAI 1063]